MRSETDLSNTQTPQDTGAIGLDAAVSGRSLVSELLESLPDPVIGCDAGGHVVHWSPAALDAYGYTTEEAVGERVSTLLVTRFPRPLLEIIEEVTDVGRWQGRLVHRTKGGREVAVESRWVARYDDAGKLVGWFGVEREIAAAGRLQSRPVPKAPAGSGARRRRQADRLESLAQLAGGVAHDFNNALAIIINYASFVRAEVQRLDCAPTEAQRAAMGRDLDEISVAAARATALTNQLLAFSRQDAVQPPDGRVSAAEGTILLVEDAGALADMARRILVSAGYEVIVAADDSDAIDLAGAHEGTIDLLLTEMVMPGLPGTQLADRLRVLRPAMAVAYMSGHATSLPGSADHGEPSALISKPFTAPMLLAGVRQVLGERGETRR
jgi:PAS domain S-box-containing protein